MRARLARLGPLWVVVPALMAGVAALAIPGATSTATAEGTVLAVGALALLAGHTWGLIVVVSSHVSLVGRLWPALAQVTPDHEPSTLGTSAIAVVLVTALPTLILAALLLPRVAGHLLADKSPRIRALCVGGGALFLAASLVLPAL